MACVRHVGSWAAVLMHRVGELLCRVSEHVSCGAEGMLSCVETW